MGNNGLSPGQQAHADQLWLAYRAEDAAHASSPEQLAQHQIIDDELKRKLARHEAMEREKAARLQAEARAQQEKQEAQAAIARAERQDRIRSSLRAGGYSESEIAAALPAIERVLIQEAGVHGLTELETVIQAKLSEPDNMYAEFAL